MDRVVLRTLIDPVLLEHARLEAKASGLQFSRFIERAVQQAVSKASVDRANRDAIAHVSVSYSTRKL